MGISEQTVAKIAILFIILIDEFWLHHFAFSTLFKIRFWPNFLPFKSQILNSINIWSEHAQNEL